MTDFRAELRDLFDAIQEDVTDWLERASALPVPEAAP